MTESIEFPEEYIPEVVEIIRAGIIAHQGTNKSFREAKKQLERQCKKLKDYWED